MKARKHLWLANILLTALVLWAAYSIYHTWDFDRQRATLVPPAGGPHTEKGEQLNKKPMLAHYQDVINRDIFGTASQPQAESKSEAPKAEEIQVSRRNLHLKGTVVGGKEKESYAIISDGKAAEGDVYRLNDVLQNARVVEILPDRVILDSKGTREALLITYELGIGEQDSAGPQQRKSQSPQISVKPRGGSPGANRVAK